MKFLSRWRDYTVLLEGELDGGDSRLGFLYHFQCLPAPWHWTNHLILWLIALSNCKKGWLDEKISINDACRSCPFFFLCCILEYWNRLKSKNLTFLEVLFSIPSIKMSLVNILAMVILSPSSCHLENYNKNHLVKLVPTVNGFCSKSFSLESKINLTVGLEMMPMYIILSWQKSLR